jgi:hypothetical protein
MIRNDYNVVFAFLMLIILNRFYIENPKLYSKILIHMLAALIVVDVLWFIIILPYWNSDSAKNPYWESLSTVHSFVLFVSFIEVVLKAGIAFLIFNEFRTQYPDNVSDLFKISYQEQGLVASSSGTSKYIFFYLF